MDHAVDMSYVKKTILLLYFVVLPIICGQIKDDHVEALRDQVLKCLESVYWIEIEYVKWLEREMTLSSVTSPMRENGGVTSQMPSSTLTESWETHQSIEHSQSDFDGQRYSATQGILFHDQSFRPEWSGSETSTDTSTASIKDTGVLATTDIFRDVHDKSHDVSTKSDDVTHTGIIVANSDQEERGDNSNTSGILPSHRESLRKMDSTGTDLLSEGVVRSTQREKNWNRDLRDVPTEELTAARSRVTDSSMTPRHYYSSSDKIGKIEGTIGGSVRGIFADYTELESDLVSSSRRVSSSDTEPASTNANRKLPKRRRNNKRRKRIRGKGKKNRNNSRRRKFVSAESVASFSTAPLYVEIFSKREFEEINSYSREESYTIAADSSEKPVPHFSEKIEGPELAPITAPDTLYYATPDSTVSSYGSMLVETLGNTGAKYDRVLNNTNEVLGTDQVTDALSNFSISGFPVCIHSNDQLWPTSENVTSNFTESSSSAYNGTCSNGTTGASVPNITHHNVSDVSPNAIVSPELVVFLQRSLRNLTSEAARAGFLQCVRNICGQGWGESGCGSYMFFSSPCGSFTNIGFTDAHDGFHVHASCQWIVQVPDGFTVNLTLVTFSIEYSGSACSLGSVAIYDGINATTAPAIGRFCGVRETWSVYSTGRSLTIVLTSSVRHRFRAEYQAINVSEWRFLKPAQELISEDGQLVKTNTTASVRTGSHEFHKWYIKTTIGKYVKLSWRIKKNIDDTASYLKVYSGRSERGILVSPDNDIPGESSRFGDLKSFSYELYVIVGVSLEFDGDFSFNASYQSLEPPKCAKHRSAYSQSCVEKKNITEKYSIAIHKYQFKLTNDKGIYEQYALGISQSGQLANFKLNALWFPHPLNDLCDKAGVVVYAVRNLERRHLMGPFCGKDGMLTEAIPLPNATIHIVIYAEPYSGPISLNSANFIELDIELVPYYPRFRLSFLPSENSSTQLMSQMDKFNITENSLSVDGQTAKSFSLSVSESSLKSFSRLLIILAEQYDNPENATISIRIKIVNSVRRTHTTVKLHSHTTLKDSECVSATANIGNGEVTLLDNAHLEGSIFEVEYGIYCPFVSVSFMLDLSIDTRSQCISDYITPLSWNADLVQAIAIPTDCSHRDCNCFHNYDNSAPLSPPPLMQPVLSSPKQSGLVSSLTQFAPFYYHTTIGTGTTGPPWKYYIIETRPEECQTINTDRTLIESKFVEIQEFATIKTDGRIPIAFWERETSTISTVRTVGTYQIDVKLYFEGNYILKPKRHIELVYSLFEYDLLLDADDDDVSGCADDEAVFDGACYSFYAPPARITWAESEANCINLGGNLVSVLSERELRFLRAAVRTIWGDPILVRGYSVVYLGLTKEIEKNWFRWSDDSPLGVTDWFSPSSLRDFNATEVLSHPSISNILRHFDFLQVQQPLMDVSLNCTVMLIQGSEISTKWVTVPCQFPMEKVGYICKRVMASKTAWLLKETQGHFAKIGTDHDEYDAKIHNIGRRVPFCPIGWEYHLHECHRLIRLDDVYNMSLLEESLHNELQPPAVQNTEQDGGILLRMCNVSIEVCRTAIRISNMATMPMLMSTLGRFRHTLTDGGVWVNDAYGNCSTLLNAGMSFIYNVDNIERWFNDNNESFQAERWFPFDLKESSLKLRVPYIFQSARHVLCRTPVDFQYTSRPTADPDLDRNDVERYCPSPWHFRCTDKTCILQHHKCDGITDCLDGSDELDCPDFKRCYHRCDSGEYVPLSKACDFIPDCDDNSDEEGCVFPTCPNGTFTCNNGQCVSVEHRCDGKYDCFDKSDEQYCAFNSIACLKGIRIPAISPSYGEPFCRSGVNITQLHQARDVCSEGTLACSDADPTCYLMSESCIYDLNDNGNLSPCIAGEHISNCADFNCPNDYHFKCTGSYCIPLSRVCDGVWDCPYGMDEVNCQRYSCPGMFRCQGHNECIHHDLVCDGTVHCKDTGDDEKFCDTPKCPGACDCLGFAVECSNIGLRELPDVDKGIRGLFFRFNKLSPNSSTFSNFHFLRVLDISDNDIRTIRPDTFLRLVNLVELNLANNDITVLNEKAFAGLANLKILNIRGNPLKMLKSHALSDLSSLPNLDIYNTDLHTIQSNAFYGMNALRNLSIVKSKLTTVTNHSFSGLPRLELLSLDGNKLPPQSVPHGIFLNLSDNITLNTGSFRLCCLAQHIRNCLPQSNEFSSCEYLIDDMVIRLLAGCLAGVAFTCNLVVIIWRCTKVSNSAKIIPLLLENMAYSNMLMGLYLVIVTSADLHYRFIGPIYAVEFDEPWRDMFWCKFAGFVFVLSNQVSMLTVGIVMYECYACVVLPHLTNFRLKRRTAFICIGWLWSVSMLFSLLPFLGIPHLNVRSPVCQIFHFSQGMDQDWGYFTIIFLGFYSLVLVAITYGLLRIWCHIPRKDQNLDEEYFAERTAIKRRVLRVVTMDVTCWWMVHILGILALAGVQIDKQLSAYTMMVIWPMPAVVNPILYFIFYIKKGIKYPEYLAVYEPCEKHVSFFGTELETSI